MSFFNRKIQLVRPTVRTKQYVKKDNHKPRRQGRPVDNFPHEIEYLSEAENKREPFHHPIDRKRIKSFSKKPRQKRPAKVVSRFDDDDDEVSAAEERNPYPTMERRRTKTRSSRRTEGRKHGKPGDHRREDDQDSSVDEQRNPTSFERQRTRSSLVRKTEGRKRGPHRDAYHNEDEDEDEDLSEVEPRNLPPIDARRTKSELVGKEKAPYKMKSRRSLQDRGEWNKQVVREMKSRGRSKLRAPLEKRRVRTFSPRVTKQHTGGQHDKRTRPTMKLETQNHSDLNNPDSKDSKQRILEKIEEESQQRLAEETHQETRDSDEASKNTADSEVGGKDRNKTNVNSVRFLERLETAASSVDDPLRDGCVASYDGLLMHFFDAFTERKAKPRERNVQNTITNEESFDWGKYFAAF